MPQAGSPRTKVGYVRRAHGISGDVLVRPLTDAPEERYVVGATFETDEDPVRSLTIQQIRSHNDGLLITFDGIEGRRSAEALRGVSFTIADDERRTLAAGEYWAEELEGLEVVDVSGIPLGTVLGVAFGAAQDRIVVGTPGGDQVEVPFVASIVPEVRIADRRVVMDPPDGLF